MTIGCKVTANSGHTLTRSQLILNLWFKIKPLVTPQTRDLTDTHVIESCFFLLLFYSFIEFFFFFAFPRHLRVK